jgi:hypothetical protein
LFGEDETEGGLDGAEGGRGGADGEPCEKAELEEDEGFRRRAFWLGLGASGGVAKRPLVENCVTGVEGGRC